MEENELIKVAIADDHQLFRDGIFSLLEQNGEYEVVISAGGGIELMEYLSRGEQLPQVILLDLTMPDMNGFEVLEACKRKYPSIKIIVISMYDDGNYVMKCVRAGAYGYLLKNTDGAELNQAIDSVCWGKKYFNEEISAKMISLMAMEGNEPKPLSAKETEVIKLIADGLTTKEIAENLFISTRTVETHRNNMMKKWEAKNTAELVKIAAKRGLL